MNRLVNILKIFLKPYLALFIIGFLVYSNSLNNDFVFDDSYVVKDNVFIRSLEYAPFYLKGYISSVALKASLFRPVLMSTFNLNYLISYDSVAGFRIFNILLHILNVWIFYKMLELLFFLKAKRLKFFAALIFLVHPINVEAVSYLSSRSDLLVTTFLLLAFYNCVLWDKTGDTKYIFYSWLSSILAFLTKETAVAIPALFAFYFWHRYGLSGLKAKIKFYLPYAAITLLYLFLRRILIQTAATAGPLQDYWLNVITQAKVSFFYLRLFIFPHPLSIEHQRLITENVYDISGLFSLAAIILMWIFLIFHRKRFFIFKIAAAWYLCFLLPKFLVRLNFPAMEHHFYPAGIGIYILAMLFLETVQRKIVFRKFIVSLILILGLLSFRRNFDWRDQVTIWQSVLKHNPDSDYAIRGIAFGYKNRLQYEQAIVFARQAMEAYPDERHDLNLLIVMAEYYRSRQEFEQAERLLLQALNMPGRISDVYCTLGLIYFDQKDWSKAEYYWRKELQSAPYSEKAYYNLGLLFFSKEDYTKAQEYFKKFVRLNPAAGEGHYYLGVIAEKKPDINSAIGFYRKAVKFSSDHIFAHYNLGTLYAQRADKRAAGHFKKALKIKPDYAPAHYNLGLFYLSSGEPKKAHQSIQRARNLGYDIPDQVQIIFNE